MEELFSRKIAPDTILDLLTPDDAAELFAVTDANRTHLRSWLPWVDGVQDVAHSLAFIEGALEQRASKNGFQCVIRVEGRIAGVIGYHFINWSNRYTHLGYWLAAAYQGHGIMTSACRVLIDYAFNELQLNRAEIACAPRNRRSCAIPERLGFKLEGTHRQAEWLYDHYVDNRYYAILRSEWDTGK